jgi:ankyrin repeat protein
MNSFVKTIILLISLFTSVNISFSQNNTNNYSSDLSLRFLEAASYGDYSLVVECVKKGVDVNTKSWEGVTALMYATASGNKKIVQLLLDKGAQPNVQPVDGKTALITASQYGYTDIAEMLLRDSALVNIEDNNKATALHYASLYNNDTIVFMLLQAGADPNVLTNDKSSPLTLASLNGSLEAAYLLVDAGALVNHQDKAGFTPLMLASQSGNSQLVQLLLNHRADVNLYNNRGYSALSMAILNKHSDVVDILLQNGANPNETNSISLNPRAIAKITGDSAVTALIKTSGGHINYLPAFSSMGAGVEINFNANDFITGFYITQHDYKFNLDYNFGFSFRPKAIVIESPIPDVGYYQFMERRFMFHLDLTKNFRVKLNNRCSAGINLGVRGLYTYGKYKGTDILINGGFFAAPAAWLYYQKNNFEIRCGYHYSNYGENDLNKSHITIGMHYNFYNFKPQKINRKLKWIE